MTTSDAIAIGAACVGAGLALLALVVAVLSIWGYFNIRSEAKRSAREIAKTEVMRLLDEKSDIGVKLKSDIDSRIAAESDRLFDDLSLSGAFAPAGISSSEPIAENYPKGEPNDGP